jgi:hypothetical protein
MFRALITSIPFTRKSTINNQEWNALPRSILHNITQFIRLERLFYPSSNKCKQSHTIYNTSPFIHIAKDGHQYSMDSIPLPEYKPLTRKYCNTYLIDTFYRDLSIYNYNNSSPDNKILASRTWINYNQTSKLLQILSVQEEFDYHFEFAAYLKYLHSTRGHPDFNAGSNNHKEFLAQLQKLD